MRALILVFLILVVVFPTAAQRGQTEEEMPPLLSIEEVTVNNEDGLTLNLTVIQTDGCDFPLTVEQSLSAGGVLLIDVQRDIAALTDTVCASEPITTEIEVEVESEFIDGLLIGGDRLYLVVNDAYFTLPIERSFASDLQTVVREDLGINAASIEAGENEGEFVLVVAGMYNTTCLSPDIVRQTLDGNTLRVEMFKLVPRMPSTEECPQTFAPPTYEGRIPLAPTAPGSDAEAISLQGGYVIEVNDYSFTYDFDTATQGEMPVEATPVEVVVESAEVLILESFPPQLSLQVVGYHPDSCEFPVIIEQTQDENTITVRVYRELPPNVRCASAIVPYEESINLGAFDPGTYTIVVNGTTLEVEI